jgi:hypothetical protein
VLSALFENMGNRNVIPQAALYQIQTYNANGRRIIASNKLNIMTGPQINSRSIDEWNTKVLKIPAVSPSISSALIRVEYFVKVKNFKFKLKRNNLFEFLFRYRFLFQDLILYLVFYQLYLVRSRIEQII